MYLKLYLALNAYELFLILNLLTFKYEIKNIELQ